MPIACQPDWSAVPAVRVDGYAAGCLVLDLAGGRPVRLLSDHGIAGLAGAGWWAGLLRAWNKAATGPFLALLDCADLPGQVMAALRAGVTDIVFDAGPQTPAGLVERLSSLADAHGSRLHNPPVNVVKPCWRRNRDAPLRQYLSQHIDFTHM